MAATLSQLTSWRAHTQLHARTEDTHEVRHVRPAAPATAALPKLWAAVRACAVTLNTKLRVCRRGVISRKEMVRSARSIEECVQCGPRSEFIVKEAAHKNSGRQPEEDDRPDSLGAFFFLHLLRGESRL